MHLNADFYLLLIIRYTKDLLLLFLVQPGATFRSSLFARPESAKKNSCFGLWPEATLLHIAAAKR